MTPTIIYIILGTLIAGVFALAAYEYSDKKKIVEKFSKTLTDLEAHRNKCIDELTQNNSELIEEYEGKLSKLVDTHNAELEELRDLHIQSIEKMSKDYVQTIEDQNEALELYEKHLMQLDYTIEYTSKVIKELDIRGAYESDDELGIFFKAIKEMQGHLNQFKLDKNLQDGVQDEVIVK